MLAEINESIEILEQKERKTQQALERRRAERKRLEYQIKKLQQVDEKKRVHKMIVLGAAVCNELKKWNGGELLYEKILNSNDDVARKVAQMLCENYKVHHT